MRSHCLPLVLVAALAAASRAQQPAADLDRLPAYGLTKLDVAPGDWPQLGGTSLRNNAPHGRNIPDEWRVPVDYEKRAPKNIKWSAPLGVFTHGSPVVADGRVFVGTNNPAYDLPRKAVYVDLACLLCFDEQTGKLLWRHDNVKHEAGRLHDWPMMGIHSVPLVDGERLWYVTNRAEVVCLDTRGFDDGENDGPIVGEAATGAGAADIVWRYDLIAELGVHPHERSVASVTCADEVLLVCTGNGVDNSDITIPAPHAPSFAAFDRRTGKLLWSDASPGAMILHGQWSSPAYAVLGGKPQVLMAGGDGWLYSFDPRGDGRGNPRLWWKFDGNLKLARHVMFGRGARNEIVATPVIYDGKVYLGMGQDPDHGEGQGCLWCLDPTKRFDGGDVSAELQLDAAGKPAPRRPRDFQLHPGETVVPNPQSAVVWKYESFDLDGNGAIEKYGETMFRTSGAVAVKDDLLYVVDIAGFAHCVDAQTGKPYWTHDLFAGVIGWNQGPLVVDGKVFVTAEDYNLAVFRHGKTKEILAVNEMDNAIHTTPIVANNVLFIATKTTLYAIAADKE